jgi:hypothetical protein
MVKMRSQIEDLDHVMIMMAHSLIIEKQGL